MSARLHLDAGGLQTISTTLSRAADRLSVNITQVPRLNFYSLSGVGSSVLGYLHSARLACRVLAEHLEQARVASLELAQSSEAIDKSLACAVDTKSETTSATALSAVLAAASNAETMTVLNSASNMARHPVSNNETRLTVETDVGRLPGLNPAEPDNRGAHTTPLSGPNGSPVRSEVVIDGLFE